MSVSPISTSVTSRPRARSDAAVSAPMKLPPMTIAEWASSAAAETASASASVRYVCTPTRSAPGIGKHARAGAGGEHERAVRDALAARELDLVLRRVDRLDRRPEPELDDVVLVLLERPHEGPVAVLLAAEEALRQRGPVVRGIGLGREDRDLGLAPAARYSEASLAAARPPPTMMIGSVAMGNHYPFRVVTTHGPYRRSWSRRRHPSVNGRADRIGPAQGVLRRPPLRRGLVPAAPGRPARARGPERRRQDDAAPGDRRARPRSRAASSRSRRTRASRSTTSGRRAGRASPCASTRSRAPATSSRSRRSSDGSRRRWREATTRPRRCAATARPRRGSSTRAAGRGATGRRRSSAGSGSPTPTSTARSTRSRAASSRAPRSRARSPPTPTCCCSTSRRTTSTSRTSSGSSASSRRSTPP